jgi:putative flippase GtrA
VTETAGGSAADSGAGPGGAISRLRGTINVLYREMLKFGVVGAVAFIVDGGGFNLLVYAGGDGPLRHKVLTAKIISATTSIVVAWLGNRYWTFRHRRRPEVHAELLLFFAVNGIGLLIAVACLGFSRYVLGLDSALANNISGTFVGTAFGTLFRFWAYRRFVFSGGFQSGLDETAGVAPAPGPGPAAPR